MATSLLAPVQAAEETEGGNNLSYPVLWAEEEGHPIPLGTAGVESFDGQIFQGTLTTDPTSAPCYAAVQKDLGNSWQAENSIVGPDHKVTVIDWGDNLEVKDWGVNGKVRVETSLYDTALGDGVTMNRYEMCYVGGKGQTEVWGARVNRPSGSVQATKIDNPDAMVFTAGARLTIQRIDDPSRASWDASAHRWVGVGAADPEFNSAVYEATGDGPGSYAAEINVQGKIVYGFNWDTTGLYNGEYRLTFSIDGANDAFPNGPGTSLMGATIMPSAEESESELIAARAAGGSGGSGGSANVAVVDGANELTYIDVGLSGGEDAPPIDDGDGTTPPPSGGTTPPPTGGTAPPPTSETGGTSSGSTEAVGPNPIAVPPVVVVTQPELAQSRIRQTARNTAPRGGKYRLGKTIVLTKRPIKTNAGVTLRWRATVASQDNCLVKVRKGKATAKLIKPGKCKVVAYAPAPSPDFLRYRETRTYRVKKG